MQATARQRLCATKLGGIKSSKAKKELRELQNQSFMFPLAGIWRIRNESFRNYTFPNSSCVLFGTLVSQVRFCFGTHGMDAGDRWKIYFSTCTGVEFNDISEHIWSCGNLHSVILGSRHIYLGTGCSIRQERISFSTKTCLILFSFSSHLNPR